MQIDELYQLFLQYPSVQTDTRKLQKGDIFFALKGPNFNGNLFAKQALGSGAAYVIADEAPGFEDTRIMLTDDVLATLQQLAGYHRRRFSIPFIAITGSNGKTTTKELVHAVLSSTYKTYTTRGNLNNHIGIPLTILSIKPDAEMAIIEMGANHLKEIEGYCKYTEPTHGIITNCGKAHLEGFGSIEGVRKAKGELYDYLKLHGGTAFVMRDYDYLNTMSKGIPHIFTYGTSGAAVTGNIYKTHPFLEVALTNGKENSIIRSRLVGDYNLPNILAAVATGRYFNISDDTIKAAIEAYHPSNSRSQLIEKGSNTIILDAYNANPSSMKAAIENFAATPGSNKILVLGAMMELGKESAKEHEVLIELLNHYLWKEVILVGGDFARITHPFRFFNTVGEAKEWLQQHPAANSVYLVKGSRSMQMEIIVDIL
ncbi:UDP-N-acetylmuramoyl-tripeptide--D-alanyl-D-alanine ligase [Agriterribacter sp.]|mgnify:FL=1|uniref:UDP-N-acetylmuramoyl-tripeptide--D-alanyl-D- alanine ligase n=1 Tax=Agriterribacter sp. TaxID=2821509 RepID=UPI002C7290F1|nr:UDP-N-acetylmuramoyl-tripeptide--D-alanyl-D-alanine ligase [Agriterribacter sp.]HRO44644.1 UDP-N-acetylmuramoyl-tripeptide--D-alanyl-D-alanine ligase [Agriterribacter sp.]HRQ16081.1 UDP-N-acetylmuramoyl-tripeptide--D-alanyl-D-alanine ligase [Agriterribacter sp.]